MFALGLSMTTVSMLAGMAVVMSSLYDISARFKPNLRVKIQKNGFALNRNLLAREVNACPNLRCRVGSVYHMEAKAKLTLVHSVLNGVGFLLINIKV